MLTQIPMPALSPTIEEGKLSKWLVIAGDAVKPDQGYGGLYAGDDQ